MKNNLLGKITTTLRGRLSLWYLSSIGFILLFSAATISSVFWLTLQDQIDHHVQIAVYEARQIVQNYQGEERDSLIKNLVSAQGMTVVVLSPDGTPILETNSPDVALVTEHQLQKISTSTSLYQAEPTLFTEGNIRFAAMPVEVKAGKGIVAVGYSTKIILAAFYKMILVIAAVVILLVLPITFIGYRLLKKQLRPLESISKQAKSVSDLSSLSKRISISSPTEEVKTIQQALNSMLSQLENMFKAEREFFSDAAHTLKTPLSVLRSQIENSNMASKKRDKLLTTIDATNDTISDLLFLAEIGHKSESITTFSLTKMITDLSELAVTLGEDKSLQVSASIQEDVTFTADEKLLARALGNIVLNAVSYNKPRGTINLSLKKQSHHIVIKVRDTGMGIRKKDQPHLFSRFFRGQDVKSRGSGLGLSIAKAVIENFGGKILLESTPGKGTTVTVTF